MPGDILSISELNALIKDVVGSGFPSSFWICGEIQNLDRYKSKSHLFFDLIEKEAGGKDIKAKIGAAIWAGVRPRIEAILKRSENNFDLKDGIEVKFSGKIDFYAPYGTLRFIIDGIDPTYTLGKMAQDRQKLIAELTRTGVLAKNKTFPFPVLPLRIGLVTAFDSAAYNDFIDELRKSGYAFEVMMINAVMQGKNCESSVVRAFERLNALDGLDMLVLTRGGGSIAELGAFDSKAIAMAIAGARYPVLTGIGHEINTSVADMAAHTFAKTPTAAAQMLIETVHQAMDGFDSLSERMTRAVEDRFLGEKDALHRRALALQSLTGKLFDSHKAFQTRSMERLRQLPARVLARQAQDLNALQGTLKKSLPLRLRDAHTKINHLEQVALLSAPECILRRGFSIIRSAQGHTVRSTADVHPGDELQAQLYDGALRIKVLGINI